MTIDNAVQVVEQLQKLLTQGEVPLYERVLPTVVADAMVVLYKYGSDVKNLNAPPIPATPHSLARYVFLHGVADSLMLVAKEFQTGVKTGEL